MFQFVTIVTNRGIWRMPAINYVMTLLLVGAMVAAIAAAAQADMEAEAMVGVSWMQLEKARWMCRKLWGLGWQLWPTRKNNRLEGMSVLLTRVSKVSQLSKKTEYWQFSFVKWIILVSESVVFNWFTRSCLVGYFYFYVGQRGIRKFYTRTISAHLIVTL